MMSHPQAFFIHISSSSIVITKVPIDNSQTFFIHILLNSIVNTNKWGAIVDDAQAFFIYISLNSTMNTNKWRVSIENAQAFFIHISFNSIVKTNEQGFLVNDTQFFSSTFHWVPLWTFHLISSIHDLGQLWIHLVFLLYFWSCFIGFVNQLGRSFGQWCHRWSKLFPSIIPRVGLFHLFFIELNFEFHLFPIRHSKVVLKMKNDQEALVDNAKGPRFVIHIAVKMNSELFMKICHPHFIQNE